MSSDTLTSVVLAQQQVISEQQTELQKAKELIERYKMKIKGMEQCENVDCHVLVEEEDLCECYKRNCTNLYCIDCAPKMGTKCICKQCWLWVCYSCCNKPNFKPLSCRHKRRGTPEQIIFKNKT